MSEDGALERKGSGRRFALSVLLVAVGYYLGGYISIALRSPPSSISTIWPPNAILLAALLLTPPRKWWVYLAAALPAHLHLVATFQPTVPLLINFIQYGGNILQALIAAAALRALQLAPPRFDDVRSVGWFIVIAAAAAPVLASAITVLLFNVTDWVPEFCLAWRRRILTNTVPALTVAPLIVMAVTGGPAALRRIARRQWLEFGGLAFSVLVVGIPLFGWQASGNQHLPALSYALLPVFLWAAVRFGNAASPSASWSWPACPWPLPPLNAAPS